MTTLREAAQQALEALEALQGGCTDQDDGTVEAITVWCPEVIDALRTALAEEALQRLSDANQEIEAALEQPVPVADRAAFERHAKRLGYSVDPDTREGREGGYWSSHTHLMWQTWQAALEQTVQEPLSNEELDRLWREPMSADWEHREYARAIEAAHGIRGNT